jgi:hypothetical protein
MVNLSARSELKALRELGLSDAYGSVCGDGAALIGSSGWCVVP